jgi:hypothetical protein
VTGIDDSDEFRTCLNWSTSLDDCRAFPCICAGEMTCVVGVARPCVIDGCPHPPRYLIRGHPDDTTLCTEHYWSACEYIDGSKA